MDLPLVAGKYVLIRRIAAGGMAELYLARPQDEAYAEVQVVIKRILPHLADNHEYVRMFMDEAKTAVALRHDNLVHTFEIGDDQGARFMVMEYLHGHNLRAIQSQLQKLKQQMPVGLAVRVIMEACSGLHYAHQQRDIKGRPMNIVHRDVSPQNIVVTYDGRVKLVDFGIAKAAHQSMETVSGVLKGKYAYMSPEQALGQALDSRSDQYSLGIVLYELSTMCRLYKSDSDLATLKKIIDGDTPAPSAVSAGYPEGLETILLQVLSRHKEKRFSDCEDLRDALESFLEKEKLPHGAAELGQFLQRLFQEETTNPGVVVPKPVALAAHRPNSVFRRSLRLLAKKRWLVALAGGAAGACFALLWVAHQLGLHQPIVMPDVPLGIQHLELMSPMEQSPHLVEAPAVLTEKGIGRLKVVVRSWADVYVDGAFVGRTPMQAKALSVGTHIVRVENPVMNKRFIQTIQVRPGKDTLLRTDW